MAVAEGTVGGRGGARVFKTTDGGANWNMVYLYAEMEGGSALAIKMLSETEAWVGTSMGTSMLNAGAEMSYTNDGGATWSLSTKLVSVGAITEMSFSDSRTAYAVAITTA